MYVLDTNVVSELRKTSAGRADPSVVHWVDTKPIEVLHISAVTMFELELGVLQVERSDPAKGHILRSWINHDVQAAFRSRILPVDAEVMTAAAALHVPDPMSLADSMIAATAVVNGFVVVTHNTADFARDGVRVIDPWTATDAA